MLHRSTVTNYRTWVQYEYLIYLSIYLLRHSLLYSPHVTQPLHHCITATQNRITTDDAIRYSQPPSLPAAKGIEGGRVKETALYRIGRRPYIQW